MMHKGYQVDLGAAFNQNNDAFTTRGVFYNPTNTTNTPLTINGRTAYVYSNIHGAPQGTNGIGQMYKSMQFLYASRKWGQTKVSTLVFKDDFQKFNNGLKSKLSGPVAGDTLIYVGDRYLNSRWTMGANFTSQIGNASGFGKIAIAGGAFVQRGNNKFGKNLEAYMANLSVMYQKGKFQVGPAIDYLSGNNTNDPNKSGTDNRFDPLYGTPHKWWGYMDYFYVGTGGAKRWFD